MKRNRKDKFIILFFTLNLALFLSCGDSSTGPSDAAPEIPPTETMTVDLSLFNSANPSAANDAIASTKINFLAAVFVVTVVNAFVVVSLSAPVAATAAALNEQPTLEGDGKWHWRYSHTQGVNSFDLELTAEVRTDEIRWEMFVTSASLSLDNFLWYDGVTDRSTESGFWQFYDDKQPTSKVELLKIDFDYISNDDKTLTFLNNKPGDPGNGSTIAYDVAGDIVTMNLVNTETSETAEISWNRNDGSGYIEATNYNNEAKSCWNETRDDVICPGS